MRLERGMIHFVNDVMEEIIKIESIDSKDLFTKYLVRLDMVNLDHIVED